MDLLIKNARVWDDRPPVDIGIEGERIAAIEPGIEADAGRVIDAGGRAVLPGFVEPHLHLDKALLYRRQPTRDGTLEEAIRLTGQLKAEQDRDDVLERSRPSSTWPSRTAPSRSARIPTSTRSRA